MEKALSDEANLRIHEFLTGLKYYLESPYERNVQEPPVIWQTGNARVLDYGALYPAETMPKQFVFFVPSLINRYYILDLDHERSFLRYLAKQGFYPLVLDWGAPGEQEQNYGCEDYVTQILMPALQFVSQTVNRPIALAGYCMGGVLSMAAAQLCKQDLAGIALLATPWDFACNAFAPFQMDAARQHAFKQWIDEQGSLPGDIVQALFYMTDIWIFTQKFRRLSNLSPDSAAAKDFIALEHWVNDGVPIVSQVAKECLIDWAQHNCLKRLQWKVQGKIIKPQSIKLPAFIAIPKNDSIVPYHCALPLTKLLPHATVIEPEAGHVGMIVGSNAKQQLWTSFASWLEQL